ncbi:hypothetical protein ACFFHM_05410 [Halalkalibacter kiskunsagensis]|uniref:Aminodeoxychorismate lyase n=2 Tax=Halalkalibacter kiskunsagensis TaxID=1548599 RepID=A0ABV6KAP5_9BACI
MKANSIRSFAIGLIAAATVCGGVYFLGPTETASTQAEEKLSVEEMKTMLASEGYVIQTEDEWQMQLAAIEEAEAAAQEVEEPKEVKEEKEGEEIIIYRTMLTVSPGMTSIDVGEALVRAHIIDSAIEFYNEVEKRGLANELRPGTFDVESEMTLAEVISTIF